MRPELFAWFADAVLMFHVLFVLFVVVGHVLILVGGFLDWMWVKNLKFRLLHVLAIGIVVSQSWLGIICPLTHLENYFRRESGDQVYSGSFVAHWLNDMLYIEAPWWAFAVAYSVFGATVVAAWIWVRPTAWR